MGVGVSSSGERHSCGVVVLLSSSLSGAMRCSPSMVEVARLVASLLSYSASSASWARYCLCLSALSWSAWEQQISAQVTKEESYKSLVKKKTWSSIDR